MTGCTTVKNAVDATKLRASDYLAKLFLDDELIGSVDKAIENKRLVEQNRGLRIQLHERYDFNNIVGQNQAILGTIEKSKKSPPPTAHSWSKAPFCSRP